jgi:hypothetical protein
MSHVNISSTRVQDGGLYTCKATNSLGSVTHAARLNIYGELCLYVYIVLRVVLYGCETWYLTLREEHILREYLDRRQMR